MLSLVPLAILILCLGCDEPPLTLGVSNWRPTSVGGPIETRPLPPSNQIYADYQKWKKSDSRAAVRLYEATLVGMTNQLNYEVNVYRGKTPLGTPLFTYVSFYYQGATNGLYHLVWEMRGKHDASFLKLAVTPKVFLLQLISAPEHDTPFPRLQIVAVEGVETRQVLPAELGGEPP